MTSRIDYNNPHGAGALSLSYHYEMVSDTKRVVPFKKALQKSVKGRVVIESGAGTGIMCILAAKAGARLVFGVEIDPAVAEVARKNIAAAGVADRVRLLAKSTLDVVPGDLEGQKPAVVIAENLSTWFVTEPQIPVMNHINATLAQPNAIRLPTRVFNTLELASTRYHFEDVIVRAHFFQFTGIKAPVALSKKTLFRALDMSQKQPLDQGGEIEVKVTKSGVLNSLRLTSPLEVVPGIRFSESDSLMPPVVVPLQNDLKVKKGDKVRIRIEYTTNTSWESFRATAE